MSNPRRRARPADPVVSPGADPAVDPVRDRVRDPGRDRGSSALELVLITPVLIALVFGLVQTALVWNARHTVGSAAQHGARLARTATALSLAVTSPGTAASPTTGATSSAADVEIRRSTLSFLRQTGGASLRHPTVTIAYQGLYAVVTVSGTTVGVLPGTSVRVSGSSRTPVEGFRP
jgi:Flp pilus assembly protein TadG